MSRASLVRRCVVAAFAVGAASSLDAYKTFSKWGTPTATFYVNPANADVSANAAIEAVQAGMASWNDQAGTPFRIQYGGTVGDTSITVDHRNVVIFRPNFASGSMMASTYTWSSNGRLVDADITFYTKDWTFYAGNSTCSGSRAIYIEDVAAHEFGHAIGITHSGVSGATMYPSTTNCSKVWRTLAADDIAAARSLYGIGAGNTAPTVTITTPLNGASVAEGASILFSGASFDTQDGNISGGLQWTDNGNAIGAGASFSRVLAAGSHTIVARSTDSGGMQGSRQISVTVNDAAVAPVNTAPVVTITAPVHGASFAGGTAIAFRGTSLDAKDGNISAGLLWTDNGVSIGVGASFSRVLTAGTHTIAAKSKDSDRLWAKQEIRITVTPP